jgi:hypothetical protein
MYGDQLLRVHVYAHLLQFVIQNHHMIAINIVRKWDKLQFIACNLLINKNGIIIHYKQKMNA